MAALSLLPTPVNFSRDIAPILRAHCVACHRSGEIGPFPLLTYSDARRRARTIAEVVADGRMPPWHASPYHGRFRNDPRLSADEKQRIADWVRLGCPEGPPAQVTAATPEAGGWAIGTPDLVLPIPKPFEVPAEGIVEYQNFVVDPGLTCDAWVQDIEVRPGNRRVVHHCNVFLLPPGVTDLESGFETGKLGSCALIAWTPGSGPVRLPPGMAKRIPAGFRLHFVIHYTTTGTPQTDRTQLGLRMIPASEVRKEVATKLLLDKNLTIPPHATAHRVEQCWQTPHDVLLLSLFPHMHLRGRSFRYEAEFPDGTREVLLDVPEYDFNWQHRYDLDEPRRLPKGTVVRGMAMYDNSAGNPANPDPSVTVRAGQQSTDEMFNGYFDIALAEQDVAAETAAQQQRTRATSLAGIGAIVALLGLAVRRKRVQTSSPRG